MCFLYGEKELAHLKERDPLLGRAIDEIGMIQREVDPDLFSSVVHHIIGQQISTAVSYTHLDVYKRQIYPSYVLVKMIMTDDSWYVVRNIRGVTGFVGPGSKPVPLTEEEVQAMGVETKQVEVRYAVGDSVKIVDGYLYGFIGTVESIDLEKEIVKVTVSMFGKDTLAELELDQVEPLD